MSSGNFGHPEVMKVVRKRIAEFKKLGNCGFADFDFRPFIDMELRSNLRSELAFCISTANSSAIAGLKFQKSLEEGFPKDLKTLMQASGVRFWNRKAEYVEKALKEFYKIEKAIELDSFEAREKLLEIKGLGMKEASHYLRNVGREDVAIIDRHVLRWLLKRGQFVNKISKKEYLKMEKELSKIAEGMNLSLAELDLIIWFEATRKILK
ncbi:MAG: N-glycosylase/DNA lyase [Archaeoglobales archaeon]|nr:N-glycosylase/DNA lyase [Archaeoglobales archaeon]